MSGRGLFFFFSSFSLLVLHLWRRDGQKWRRKEGEMDSFMRGGGKAEPPSKHVLLFPGVLYAYLREEERKEHQSL